MRLQASAEHVLRKAPLWTRIELKSCYGRQSQATTVGKLQVSQVETLWFREHPGANRDVGIWIRTMPWRKNALWSQWSHCEGCFGLISINFHNLDPALQGREKMTATIATKIFPYFQLSLNSKGQNEKVYVGQNVHVGYVAAPIRTTMRFYEQQMKRATCKWTATHWTDLVSDDITLFLCSIYVRLSCSAAAWPESFSWMTCIF